MSRAMMLALIGAVLRGQDSSKAMPSVYLRQANDWLRQAERYVETITGTDHA